MNKKMQYLIETGLKKKFKSKSFIISNIIIFICLIGLFNIDIIIKFFGGNFDKEVNVYVVDETGNSYEYYEDTFNNTLINILGVNEYKLSLSDKTLDELKSKIDEEETEDIIINIKKSDNIFEADIISYDYIDTTIYQSLANSLNTTKYNIALIQSDIDKEELASISKPVEINRIVLDESKDEEEEMLKAVSSVIIPIFVLPFFMLTILVVSMIGAEINEEKTSKSMEIIISSVSPKIHFASKILTVNIFVLIQALLLLLFGGLGILSRFLTSGVPNFKELINSLNTSGVNYIDLFLKSEVFKDILSAIPLVLVIFLLSFIAYSLLAGILASMTTSIEDYQQLQTPLMIIMLLGYYIAIFSSMYDSAIFIKVCSYIPFMSAIVSPALLLMGEATIIDMIISIGLLIITNFLLVRYGLKVYKVGILNYSSSKLWKKMMRAVKEK